MTLTSIFLKKSFKLHPLIDDPNRSSADVISIYSDAYTNASGINYNPGWGQNTVVTQPKSLREIRF